jgi:nudix motif 8
MVGRRRRHLLSTTPASSIRSPTTSATTTSSSSPCPILTAALPRLRQRFDHLAMNNTGIFPLFHNNPTMEAHVWKTVPLNRQRQAAVLVPLVSYQGVPSLLFTLRSRHLPTHASEVSFPGGHFDATLHDTSLEDTALREAQEELLGTGDHDDNDNDDEYPWDQVEILGRATALPSIKGTPVTPIIAVFPIPVGPDTFVGQKGEVEEIFYVSLRDLVDMETSEPSERFQSNIPVFPAGQDKKIWGLTAVITRPLLHKLFQPIFLQ